MPASLEQDARAFLEARRAPLTPSNMRSIMDFLAMNQDKRPSYGSAVTPPSDTTATAIEQRVDSMVDGDAGNTNNAQQKAYRAKTRIANAPAPPPAAPSVEALYDQDAATAPADQPAQSNDPGTTPGSQSTTPEAWDNSFTGGTGDDPIGSTISKLIGPAALAAGTGAAVLASRGRGVPKVAASAADVVGSPATQASRAAIPSIPDMTTASDAAVASGRANPIGHGRDTPLVQPPERESSLKTQNRTRSRKSKRKPIKEAAD